MGHKKRGKPKYLAAKLLAIRQALGLSQTEMVKHLEFKVTPARVSEYEHGVREPTLLVLLHYSEIAGLHLEVIVDDRLKLPKRLPQKRSP
jgi:transcriptional regulator with XRE-family HTH domain